MLGTFGWRVAGELLRRGRRSRHRWVVPFLAGYVVRDLLGDRWSLEGLKRRLGCCQREEPAPPAAPPADQPKP